MLILASASPRRHELLCAAGIEHIVKPSAVPEVRRSGESAHAFVRRLAEEKAFSVEMGSQDVVLGADTVVNLPGESEDVVLGKPVDEADARAMLMLLSGRDHFVQTGICLRSSTRKIVDAAVTRVWFAALSATEIDEYVRSGEPNDKAGAYAVQGFASKFVLAIEGSYTNVVGLPVALVYRYLRELERA